MNHYLKNNIIFLFVVLLSVTTVNAASIIIDAPKKAPANRRDVIVQIVLNPEQDVISGMSGDFSFPTDSFSVRSITTESSIVSLWVKQPSISQEKYFMN